MQNVNKESIFILVLLYVVTFISALFNIYALLVSLVVTLIYHIVMSEQEKKKVILDYERKRQRYSQDMHKTEKKLYEKEQELHQLVNSLSVGLIMTDALGKILYANKQIRLDLKLGEIDNIKVLEESDVKKVIILSHITRNKFEREIQHNNKYYLLSIKPINAKDMFTGVIVLMYDITSVKNLSNKQKDFIANVSHELKTPLASIKGVSELLNRDSDADKELLDVLSFEANRMEKIVGELLSYTKIDSSEYTLNITEVNLEDIVNRILTSKRNMKDNVKVNIDLKVKAITGDTELVELMLRNLIRNAGAYTQDFIHITSYLENNNIVLKVTDNGIGIREEHVPKIFDRFYRVDESRNRVNGGTGLGLSIVKSIILKHNWQISVDSKYGVGTTFTINIPVSEV